MITEHEARLSAEVWVREEVKNVPEVVGAILAGSTRERDPAAPHPAGSDVDIFIFVKSCSRGRRGSSTDEVSSNEWTRETKW